MIGAPASAVGTGRIALLLAGACAGLAATWAAPAVAALGGDASSAQADQLSMKASARSTATGRFTVHELQAPSGTTVREFASPAGKVFAVTWQGPWVPDLRQILGDYFEPYVQAAQAKRAGRGPLEIRSGGLVAQSGGRMRAFAGRAYVPELMPADVSADDLY